MSQRGKYLNIKSLKINFLSFISKCDFYFSKLRLYLNNITTVLLKYLDFMAQSIFIVQSRCTEISCS